jgi:hypothetical protein
MATEDTLARLRRMTGESDPDTTAYTDTELEQMLDEHNSDLNLAASRIWGEKASTYADLVNTTEAGSSRANSDLFAHAKQQQDYFNSISDSGVVTTTSSTTRRITRI